MALNEIAFIANWVGNNKDVVKLIAANTKWTENGIKEILSDLESKTVETIENIRSFNKQLSKNKYK